MASDGLPEALRGPWAKLELFTARFALILSQLRQTYDGPAGDGPVHVDREAMHHATLLTAYLKQHFELAILGVGRQPVPHVVRLVLRRADPE